MEISRFFIILIFQHNDWKICKLNFNKQDISYIYFTIEICLILHIYVFTSEENF